MPSAPSSPRFKRRVSAALETAREQGPLLLGPVEILRQVAQNNLVERLFADHAVAEDRLLLGRRNLPEYRRWTRRRIATGFGAGGHAVRRSAKRALERQG